VQPSRRASPSERYFMSSVESFLEHATLVSRGGERKPALHHLPSEGKDDGSYWLEIDQNARSGDLNKAVA